MSVCTRIVRRIAVLGIALVVSLSFWSDDAVGDRIQITVDAAKQGPLKGDKAGKIAATSFTLESSSPRDAASGQASGRVQNGPVTITKAVDAASPQLFQALVTNEPLKSVTIEVASGSGGEGVPSQTIRLTNASVTRIRQSVEHGAADAVNAAGPLEEVSFSYQTIEFLETAPPVSETPAPTRQPRTIPQIDRPAPTRIPRPAR